MDPRAMRTQQLIIDAFNSLIKMKNFDQISVKDITTMATINRATFYAHFVDKYELLDYVLTTETKDVMAQYFSCKNTLSEEILVQMFLSIVEIHHRLHSNCRRGYNTFTQMIEEKVKEQLTTIIETMLAADQKLDAILMSWAMYGAYVDWDRHSTEDATIHAAAIAKKLLKLT